MLVKKGTLIVIRVAIIPLINLQLVETFPLYIKLIFLLLSVDYIVKVSGIR